MPKPICEIDESSGFCFGVTTAISKAEDELAKSGKLYCLGDIVHNSDEVERLRSIGLVTITHEEMAGLRDVKVLLRAHGEPPSTYELAMRNNIEIIDATCPVVLRLQQRIKSTFAEPQSPQIVIYGKTGHAEVNGLVGQTQGKAIVVEDESQLYKVDFGRDISLYSQTTKSLEGFRAIIRAIQERKGAQAKFEYFDTICRQVANRVEHLKEFSRRHDCILFVAGAKSSNGRILYSHCLDANPRTHLVSDADRIDPKWLEGAATIGICGATSTPRWLMEKVRAKAMQLI
ncbi:MAG: 4-hydroxy-3-methylbut-2-enyl diphosphate reductase [Clostridium sp.]|nr:4-hydroxy-3-methylbut-2-enyl diphosphate reductase [Clostridium sp.]